jgi:hypothetical protein
MFKISVFKVSASDCAFPYLTLLDAYTHEVEVVQLDTLKAVDSQVLLVRF